MDGQQFDGLARRVAAGIPRRRLVALAGALLSGVALPSVRRAVGAQETCDPGLTYCPVVNNILVPTCTDLLTDGYNCGACEKVCASRECVDGACVPCEAFGQSECPGGNMPYCVDLLNDPYNCGSCSNGCDSGNCVDGACASLPCPEGLVDCAGECVDLATHQWHCGRCNSPCCAGIGAPCGPCEAGVCVTCPSGTLNVHEDGIWRCTDPATDPAHCGGRGIVCLSGVCEGGICADPLPLQEVERRPAPSAEASPTPEPEAATDEAGDQVSEALPSPVAAESSPTPPTEPPLSDSPAPAPPTEPAAGGAADVPQAVADGGDEGLLLRAVEIKRALLAAYAGGTAALGDGAFADYPGLWSQIELMAGQEAEQLDALQAQLGEPVGGLAKAEPQATTFDDAAAFVAHLRQAEAACAGALVGLAAAATSPDAGGLLAGVAAADGAHLGYLNAWAGADATAAAILGAVDPRDAIAAATAS